MEELPEIKSCIPAYYSESLETISNISGAIHRRLNIVIPITNMAIITMIEPLASSCNGYKYLWSIMRRTYQFIRPQAEGWGPDWLIEGTQNKYVVTLKRIAKLLM